MLWTPVDFRRNSFWWTGLLSFTAGPPLSISFSAFPGWLCRVWELRSANCSSEWFIEPVEHCEGRNKCSWLLKTWGEDWIQIEKDIVKVESPKSLLHFLWILLLAICKASSFLTLFFIFITAANIFSENQYQQLNICEPTITAQYSQSNSHAGSLNKKKEKQEQLSAIWSLCADPKQPLLYKAVCGEQYSCQHRRVCTVLPLKPYHPNSTAKKRATMRSFHLQPLHVLRELEVWIELLNGKCITLIPLSTAWYGYEFIDFNASFPFLLSCNFM